MNIISAIQDRRSVRAFLDKPVSEDTIKAILETARWAPSGVNHQPWQVATLDNTKPSAQVLRDQIRDQIIKARDHNIPENPDYEYYPKTWVEPYKTRRQVCGQALYTAVNIDRQDMEARKVQWYKNYDFFHAPMALIFHLDGNLAKGSWMDMGMFIQNVMLAARHHGLETCAQASLAEYPDIVRQVLSLPASQHIVCGMAVGYADWSHPINQYRTEREPLSTFVTHY